MNDNNLVNMALKGRQLNLSASEFIRGIKSMLPNYGILPGYASDMDTIWMHYPVAYFQTA